MGLGFLLLFGQSAEESDLLRARWFPLIVGLEGTLEVRLDVDIECLWL